MDRDRAGHTRGYRQDLDTGGARGQLDPVEELLVCQGTACRTRTETGRPDRPCTGGSTRRKYDRLQQERRVIARRSEESHGCLVGLDAKAHEALDTRREA